MQPSRIAVVLLSLTALFVVACEQKSPQEKVADLRAKYSATVNESGFAARAIVPEPTMALSSEEGTSDDGTSEDGASPDGEMMDDDSALDPPDLGPVRYDILLDIVVATSSREQLPELTVDMVHLDSGKREKQRWQVTLDTSGVLQGPGAQITHELEEVDYVEGDFFFTEVRHPVPADEISKYPELANSG